MASDLFTVTFRAGPGVNAVLAIRALLKIASRRLGLTCLAVREVDEKEGKDDERAAPNG
jgi:hypothetical protein